MNERLHDLMSGRWNGPVAAVFRAALSTGAVGYGMGVGWRNQRFDRGIGVHAVDVPVVSVGNLTTGGTGKTPVVAFVAQHFYRWGVRVALLSRGYKADRSRSETAEFENDEARVLAKLCPRIPHRQDPNRVAGAAHAIENWQSEILVMDDGFQHRRLARDLDIVLIDATNPFGYENLLPRGLLREPLTALRRADVIALTRVDAVPREVVARIRDRLRIVCPRTPVAEVIFPPQSLVNASGETRPLDFLEETPTVAFCGLGNPAGFASTLTGAQIRTADVIPFPDHHHYTESDLKRVATMAEARGAQAVVTTLKDLVKINRDQLPGTRDLPVWALNIGCQLVANEGMFLSYLDQLVTATTHRQAA